MRAGQYFPDGVKKFHASVYTPWSCWLLFVPLGYVRVVPRSFSCQHKEGTMRFEATDRLSRCIRQFPAANFPRNEHERVKNVRSTAVTYYHPGSVAQSRTIVFDSTRHDLPTHAQWGFHPSPPFDVVETRK